ncbi:MAG TPA: hypothetical protein VII60_04280 [Acidimicrobiales bacterium]
MKRRPYDATRLLKWYPPSWRSRYGDDFLAYVDDTLDGKRPTVGFVSSIALGAVRERAHESGLLGEHPTPAVQSRGGSLVVLCAWSVFMLAGATFSKTSEHFAKAMPAGSSSPARVGFDIVAGCGALGMILVLIGACVALPSFVAFLRSGGWTVARRRILHSLTLTVLALVAIVPLSLWSRHLNSVQRNGGDGAYSGAFIAWAVLIALTLVSWDRVALQCVARMALSSRVLRVEALLATGVSILMVTITAGAALWWVRVGSSAPWFLQGTSYGSSASPLTPNLILTLALMVVAACAGALGVSRIMRSRRHA